MIRIIALFILVIPGALAVLGIKIMRDTLFGIEYPILFTLWFQFIAGFLLFLLGLAFIAGFILYRDRKLGKTEGRFKS
ncbi:DUF2627 family protein [Pontibacillus yanchengensis]|uniref:DUF2627 family protein n=2 Tax=Pontibacillus yanchengensis TaxID=462910 RepID=A0ACC7VI25_9BACI|nr:DUF2627 family protein [Pontibacillus yanchengensis]MYL33539.1 DUF2627 family protein [Pontibacillus yanchengensis]MYL53589.1 DUF2627 family protein [Pontibacillus yanchengensis]